VRQGCIAVRGVIVLAGTAILLVGTAGVAQGFGKFKTPDPYASSGEVYGLDVGDVTRDGIPDILAGNDSAAGDHISLFTGKGDGTFEDEMSIEDPNGPEGIAIGRFNSDRKPDFAVADYDSSEIAISLGAGGGFTPGQVLDGVDGPWLIQAADIDRDGHLDLITGNYDSDESNAVSVFLAGGNGEFSDAVHYATGGAGATGLAMARMNGDKRPDVVVLTADHVVSVLPAQPGGSLGEPETVADATSYSGYDGLAVADFDGDDRNDAVVTDYEADELYLLRGNGDGTLGDPEPVAPDNLVDTGPWAIEARDLTRDGRPDLAVAGSDSQDVHILQNRRGKHFRQVDGHVVGDYPEFIAAARLNKDKGTDVVVGTDSGVEVLINKKHPEL
jgi:hypothetical protein